MGALRPGAAAVVAVTVVAGTAAACAAPSAMQLELPTLDGERFVRLSDQAGTPVLLNFWRSDCPPCVHEMPMLAERQRQHRQLRFIGVAVEEGGPARTFVQRERVGLLQLLGPAQADVLLRRFGNPHGVLPYTVVLNAAHAVCATHAGEVNAMWVDAAVRRCAPANGEAP